MFGRAEGLMFLTRSGYDGAVHLEGQLCDRRSRQLPDDDVYDGNHTNRVAERIETKVLPFFTRHLKFE